MPSSSTPPTKFTGAPYFRIENVPGFFVSDDPNLDPGSFVYHKSSKDGTVLGLINRPYDSDETYTPNNRYHRMQWQKFGFWLNHTNENTPNTTSYKVIYIGRHGEAAHNVAEAQFGKVMWDEYYSKLDNFTDPHLTPTGYGQAQDASAFFNGAIKYQKIVLPQSYYVSPLTRCMSTAMLTFSSLELPRDRPFHATVKELLREKLGVHTCDKRSTRSWISAHFNGFDIEHGFTEQDVLWSEDVRETDEKQVARAKVLLEDIFTHDNSSVISFTTHSGMINALLEAVGHRPFQLEPGGMIAVLLKGEWSGIPQAWGSRPVSPGPEVAQVAQDDAAEKAGLVFGSGDEP